MTTIKTDIIPQKPFYLGEQKTLDKKAICVFSAIGFFLDQDTFYKELKVLKSGYHYKIDSQTSSVVSETPYFKWHYSPIERPLKQIVEEFAILFETIIKEQVGNKKVILPLSGGIDSRTQAIALHHLGVQSYTYTFKGGHDETYYGKRIAIGCGFPFEKLKVTTGYLWNSIVRLAKINNCYSEFTHPRQMAFIDQYAKWGDVFCLGHWGDVLFDEVGVPDDMPLQLQVEVIFKKIVKKGGLQLAESLWKFWQLKGNFKDYLLKRIRVLLKEINIKNSAFIKFKINSFHIEILPIT